MKPISRQQVDELLVYLDCQALALERVLTFLDEFRRALIRRDTGALERMREQLEEEGRIGSEMEARRRHLMEQFAAAMGCRVERVCLSEICRRCEPMQQVPLRERQERLKALTARLRQQHLATELLVRECARLNRRLLEVLTGQPGGSCLYDAHGRSGGMNSSGLVSVKG
ncbi:MAG TPA: flagellar protein FlgN [Anaerohalosphaeraceae bacterium]|nr:flagellar protein FlgN [Anaerohalosphaeraceae bacterium]HOL87670.1 flagellar protein FlgN [Anaerohalosphaeraceae bacterium]HPP55822.1 flagellar protein FlgN [Anaerohalosphaeraceae bacterium]